MTAIPAPDWVEPEALRLWLSSRAAAGNIEAMAARRVTDDQELADAYGLLEHNSIMQRWIEALGIRLSLDDFLAHKDRFHLVTFDPTQEPTPPPLETDLTWVWGVAVAAVALGWLIGRMSRRRRA